MSRIIFLVALFTLAATLSLPGVYDATVNFKLQRGTYTTTGVMRTGSNGDSSFSDISTSTSGLYDVKAWAFPINATSYNYITKNQRCTMRALNETDLFTFFPFAFLNGATGPGAACKDHTNGNAGNIWSRNPSDGIKVSSFFRF